MKKIFFLLGIALLASRCATDPIELSGTDDSSDVELQTSQTRSTEARSLERVDGSLFVVEYGKRYLVESDVITVKYKPDLKKSARKIREIRSNRLGYIDIRVPEGVDVEEYVRELEKSGEFTSVEYNTYGEWCYSPNDVRIGEQWYLTTINAQSAWSITAGSSIVKVAIIDSGVDVNHPDLGVGTDGYSSVDASLGWNYITNSNNVVTTNGHGTRVAGIVAAKTNNSGRGIAGVAGGKGNRGITMIPYCVGIGAPDFSVVDDAIYDAVSKGARVIQLSLGGASSSAITSAINYATQNNVVVVCASGNAGASVVSYPASLSNVIAVGATNRNGTRWSYSDYGTALDVVAPGVDILSTTLNGGYNSQDGTSFAAPQVSAIAALLLSRFPHLTASQVSGIITSTASLYPSKNNELGYGLVNAHKAILGHLNPMGQLSPTFRVNTTYSVPTTLPTGVTFNGWSVDSGNCIITGGTSGRNLTIAFNAFGQFSITANYTLPGGVSYTPTLTVTVPHNIIPAPYISGSTGSVSVGNPIPGASYQWYYNNYTQSLGGPSITLPTNYSGTVKCRAYYMGLYSYWSNELWISGYAYAPRPKKED